ncbi:hypothetical protein [Streptomyces chilikensis]|uniref:Integral membrane protein n=1 Tax=Streptomyces chilikensis TaxID=1194079 RepID=A0ABV3EIS1_9ACTN
MRDGPGSGFRRSAGGLLHACASLLFGAAGHAAAGGGLPGVEMVAATLAALTVLSCVCAVRARRRRFETAVVGSWVQQVLLHLAFSTLSGRSGTGPGTGPGTGSGPIGHPAPAPAGVHEHARPDVVTSMGAAHLLATLAAVPVLLHGERLLRRMIRLLARRQLHLPACAAVPRPGAVRVPAPAGPPPLSFGARLARARTRRGPPSVIPAARTARVRPDRSRPDRVRAGLRPVHLSQRAAPRRAGRGITHDHDGNRPGRRTWLRRRAR